MNKRILAGMLVLILATLACGAGAPAQQVDNVSTIVAATMQALTVAAPTQAPQPSGKTASFGYVSFNLPTGLASGVTGEQVAAVGETNGAPWDVAPAYIRFTLNGYNNSLAKFSVAEIRVYPKQEYAAAYPAANFSIPRLENILSNPSAPMTPDTFPRVPYFNAAQMMDAQIQRIRFASGTGLRMVTQYGQGIGPISDEGLFYHFEGITSDGKYYVVVTLPIGATFLASSNDPSAPLPQGGIAFPDLNGPEPQTFNNYLTAVTDKLNATAPDAFQPSLTQLDALIQSITITSQ